MHDGQPYRVLIVDDHPIVRRGLRDLLEDETDFVVCGEAASLADALWAEHQHEPDLLIVDLALNGRDGLELIQQLRATDRDVPVLIVSMLDEKLYGARALRAGAHGYVMKSTSDRGILEAARHVVEGQPHFGEIVWHQLREADAQAPMDDLTNREMQVLRLLGEGLAPREIAQQLNLSVSTIENYRERLKKKLGLDNSRTLQRFAIRWVHDGSA